MLASYLRPLSSLEPYQDRQRGVVLVISLVLLVVMTLLGLTAMQGTGLEERMAGNMRDRELAFQAAERGLHDGERLIDNAVSLAAFNGANGLYGLNDTPPDPFSANTWTSNASSRSDTVIAGLASGPRYFINQVGTIQVTAVQSLTPGGGCYGASCPKTTDTVTTFAITARGVGRNGNSEVLLRSYYGRKF